MKKKGIGKKLLFIGVATVCMLTTSCISRLVKEHKEARSVPLDNCYFSQLTDGTYRGYYEGGSLQWREKQVTVTIRKGAITSIILVKPTVPQNIEEEHFALFTRVIERQSLHVDAISGATLTSRAYLKAIENALLESTKNNRNKES